MDEKKLENKELKNNELNEEELNDVNGGILQGGIMCVAAGGDLGSAIGGANMGSEEQ